MCGGVIYNLNKLYTTNTGTQYALNKSKHEI